MEQEKSPEERIKDAAKKVFTEKGFAGARMAEIATEAGVNKAMLNYYFRSKQQLFEMIFDEKVQQLFGTLIIILISDKPFEEKIREFISNQIDIVAEFPELPVFVLSEVNRNPELLEKKTKNLPVDLLRMQLQNIFDKEAEAGKIRPVRFEDFMMKMISLNLFPFAARPIFQKFYGIDDKAFAEFNERRKKEIADMLLNDILIQK